MAEQLTGAPTRKVMAGGLAGALTVIAVWILGQFVEIAVPPEVAAAMTTVVTFAVSYFAEPAPRDQVRTTTTR